MKLTNKQSLEQCKQNLHLSSDSTKEYIINIINPSNKKFQVCTTQEDKRGISKHKQGSPDVTAQAVFIKCVEAYLLRELKPTIKCKSDV